MASSLVLKRSTLLQQLLQNVIYNKHDIIAINKPYGLAVQGDRKTGFCLTDLLEDFAKAKGLKTKPQLAHRLDRNSTGVLLLSSSEGAAQYLGEVFRQNKIQKTYWAVVLGAPTHDQGDICIPLKEATVNGRYKIVLSEEEPNKSKNASHSRRPAHTRFKVIATNKNTCSLLELHPVSGYKHQLRVHLAQGLGTPVLGDHKYSTEKQEPQVVPLRLLQMLGFKGATNAKTGKKKIQPWQRALIPMHLHAKEVKLDELEQKPVIIRAPFPDFFTTTLSSLKLDPVRTKQRMSVLEKRHKNLQQFGISTSLRSGF